MRTTGTGPLVPIETQPAETIQNPPDHVRRGPLDVGVFDAEHERAAVPARVEPVEERGAGAADVEVAGRRGSKTNTRQGAHHVGAHYVAAPSSRRSSAPKPTYTLRSASWRNR